MPVLKGAALAINGGAPVRTRPWLDNFTTGPEDRQAALEAFDTGYLSLFEGGWHTEAPFSFWGGPYVQRLEREWAAFYGMPYAVSMNSATSCLNAAIGALEIGYGDEVIVSPYTMSACAVCALVYGAIPIFADVVAATGALDPDSIERCVTPRTKAIVIVHQFGIPADMDRVMDIARRLGLRVIEDCAQAHGATFRGRLVGTFGDVGVFSLNVNKTIQTGEGGVCITASEDLRYRLALIRNHGEAVVDAAGYDNITNIIGFNYRLTEMASAMASAQLRKLPALNDVRGDLVQTLTEAIGDHPFLEPPPACVHAAAGVPCAGCRSTYYVYPLRYDAARAGAPRETFAAALKAEGIAFGQGYTRPLYLQPIYQRREAFKCGYPFAAPANRDSRPNYERGACPSAERLFFERMLINEYVRPPQTREDVLDIARAIHKVTAAMPVTAA